MPERDTPQGTATPTAAPADVENTILDSVLFGDPDDDEDDVQDTPEQQPEPKPSEVSDEEDEDDESSDDEGDADVEEIDQPRDAKGRFVSKDAVYKAEDGEEVTVEELYKGRLRQQDYTRKTQATSEEKRLAAEVRTRADQQLQQFKEAADFTIQALQSQMPPAPDQSLLDGNSPNWDPIKFQEQDAKHRLAVQKIDQVWQKRQQAEAELTHNQQVALREKMQEEEKRIHEVIPELKDKKQAKALGRDMFRAGTEVYGFREEEIKSTIDSRVWHLLADATRWRKLQAEKGKAVEKTSGKPPMVQGRRQDPKAVQGRQAKKAWQTLQTTGGRGADGKAAADLLLDKLIS